MRNHWSLRLRSIRLSLLELEYFVCFHFYVNSLFLNSPFYSIALSLYSFVHQGMIFILKVALTVLRVARRDLLGLDFEGVLKYLRINLPKRFITTDAGEELITQAVNAKVSVVRNRQTAPCMPEIRLAEPRVIGRTTECNVRWLVCVDRRVQKNTLRIECSCTSIHYSISTLGRPNLMRIVSSMTSIV